MLFLDCIPIPAGIVWQQFPFTLQATPWPKLILQTPGQALVKILTAWLELQRVEDHKAAQTTTMPC